MDLLLPFRSSITPARRAEGMRISADCERVYDECARLPQFLNCSVNERDGLYNLLSGCFVRIANADRAELVVQWTPFALFADCRGLQKVMLSTEAKVQRFLGVMKAQAAAMDRRMGHKAEGARA
jgi:hypothetical protein